MNGRFVRVKNAASARNARPHKVAITHGGKSTALRLGVLDGRTRLARQERRIIRDLVKDLGREPTTMEAALFRSVARLDLIAGIARAEVERTGMATSAADSLIKCARELLALAESPQMVTTTKPDLSALVQAQREALREMSKEALQALGHYYHPEHFDPPQRPKPSEPPLLLLPRLRPRLRRDAGFPAPTPPPTPSHAAPQAVAGERSAPAPGDTQNAAAAREQGGPGYRMVRPKDIEVVTDERPDVAVSRWDSPWRM